MGERINDKISNMNISRQRKYQLRKMARGLCVQCGAPALPDMRRCRPCHEKGYDAVVRHQGKPKKRAKNTKFLRAAALECSAAIFFLFSWSMFLYVLSELISN